MPEQLSISRRRRFLCLLFLEAAGGALAVQASIVRFGAMVAHTAPPRLVVGVERTSARESVMVGLGVAFALLEAGHCERLLIDFDCVAVRERADGRIACFSRRFTLDDCYPSPGWPRGIRVRRVVTAIVPTLSFEAVLGSADLFALPA